MCPKSAEKHSNHEWLKLLFLTTVTLLLLAAAVLGYGIYSFNNLFATNYGDDIVVSSPDSQYTLIIRPRYDWDGAGAEFYCRTNSSNTEHQIGQIGWQDHYHPFRDGQYRIIWDKDTVTVLYAGYGASAEDDPSGWESVMFSLPALENTEFSPPAKYPFFS